MGPATGRLIYVLALVFGAALVAAVFPLWAVTGGLPAGAPPNADFATDIVGQRYFLPYPWHWPVLVVPELMPPWGVNIAFTDSNPLAVMLAKLLRPALPPFDQVITIWQALSWLAQPASAIFALRGAGEKRLLPACAVAVMASAQPAFLSGFWHSSLQTHWALLGMIGLYLRIVRHSRWALIAAFILLPALLLIHPYLVVMAATVFAAAPLTLLLRRDHVWLKVALALAASCIAVYIVAVVFGLTAGQSPGGYGHFSLNLLAPLFPVRSAIIPGFTAADLDATGGQNAGDAYLGVGLICLIVAALALCRGCWRAALTRHAGLALSCAALWLLALSNKVTAGKLLLFRLHTALGPLELVRASSRLFWPVAYVSLIAGVSMLAAKRPRLAIALLPIAAFLQAVDSGILFARVYSGLNAPASWLFDAPSLRKAARLSDRMIVVPPFGCTPGHDMPLMQPLWIAAETRMPTNTAYVARATHRQSCDLAEALAQPPAEGALLVIQPGFRPVVMARPWATAMCAPLSEYTICAQSPGVRATFAALNR